MGVGASARHDPRRHAVRNRRRLVERTRRRRSSRARSLGQNAHRMSLEWSRLEPEPGCWDDRAFARYSAIFEHARALGLRVCLTLNHFTLPGWLARRGGWLAPDAARAFEELARRAVFRFGPRRQPVVHSQRAQRSRTDGVCRLTLATRARELARRISRARGDARRARACLSADPRCTSPRARRHRLQHADPRCSARAKARPLHRASLRTGRSAGRSFPLSRTACSCRRSPTFPFALRGFKRAFDWLGLNYYGRYLVEFDSTFGRELFGRRVGKNNVRTEWNDWGEPCPSGLTRQLLRLNG